MSHPTLSRKNPSRKRMRAIADAMFNEAGCKTWVPCGRNERASARGKRIKCREPNTFWNLYVWAHECGHVKMHFSDKNRGPVRSHVKEYHAELYAHQAFARHGLDVRETFTRNAKRYVASHIEHLVGVRRERVVDRLAFDYCRGFHKSATLAAYAAQRLRFNNDSLELLREHDVRPHTD